MLQPQKVKISLEMERHQEKLTLMMYGASVMYTQPGGLLSGVCLTSPPQELSKVSIISLFHGYKQSLREVK